MSTWHSLESPRMRVLMRDSLRQDGLWGKVPWHFRVLPSGPWITCRPHPNTDFQAGTKCKGILYEARRRDKVIESEPGRNSSK